MSSESASNSLESLSELSDLDGAETVEVKVLEDLPDSSALILSSVSALADLLEDDVNAFLTSGVAHSSLISSESPGLDDHVDEVSLLLMRHDSVDISVVAAEVIDRDGAVSSSGSKKLAEVVENGFSLLLAGGDSGVSGGIVLADKGLEAAGLGSTSDMLPGSLDDSKSFVGHVGLKDVDELRVSDLAVLVEVEVVIDVSEFLAGKEDSELREEFFELKLGESAVLVSVELQEYSLELLKVIDALSEELVLDLVGDHIEFVSPVCHS